MSAPPRDVDLDAAVDRLRDADAELAALSPKPFHLPIHGFEPILAGAVLGIRRTDWWVPGLRERVGAVLRDVPVDRLVDGTRGARPYRVAPPTTAPALRALTAVGLAVAHPESAVLVHLGLGSASDGAFHEALNLAALRNVKVIFLLATAARGPDAPVGPQLAAEPVKWAQSFGIPATIVDGRSSRAVFEAVLAARARGGPQFIEARR
jgi:pyruvate dehydrogenase E1 component alpha subunit